MFPDGTVPLISSVGQFLDDPRFDVVLFDQASDGQAPFPLAFLPGARRARLRTGEAPGHLPLMHLPESQRQIIQSLGHGVGYVYAHDAPYGVAEQQYAPDVVLDRVYYRPPELGAEAGVKQRWERVRRIIRGK